MLWVWEPTCFLVRIWIHSPSKTRWGEQYGSLGQWFYDKCSDPRVCWASLLGHRSIEWPGQWYFECELLWQIIHSPLGYVTIRVQVEGVWGYDEDQVALVIPDPTDFGSQMPVILGMLTINQIINMTKENEIDELSVSTNGSRISHLLACHRAELLIGSKIAADQILGPTDLNEAVKPIKREEINAFSSKIIHTQTRTILLGCNVHLMMQTLEEGDRPCLPHGLSIMNTYTKMTIGSKQIAVIVKNPTVALITIAKGVKIAWVMAVNAIPQIGFAPGTLEKLDKMQRLQWAKMSVEQRREALFQ